MTLSTVGSIHHTDCLDFIEELRAKIPPLCPDAHATVCEMLAEARCASHIDAEMDVFLMNEAREMISQYRLPSSSDALDRTSVSADTQVRTLDGRAVSADTTRLDPVAPFPRERTEVTPNFDHNQGDAQCQTNLVPPNVAPPAPQMTQQEADRTPPRPGFSTIRNMAAVPTQEQLAQTHQRVVLKNTDHVQTHFVQDRHLKGHELKPGQSAEVDMTTDAIETLVRLSRTDRGFFESGPRQGQPFPAHPVKVLDIGA